MRTTNTVTTKNGITWYYEQEGSGPHVVLVPDGLGDCVVFSKPMSLIAAEGFTVTTFDMPGLSRSSKAPPETYTDVTPQKLASYVISIMDELQIDVATIWGCSSGGSTVLALIADYPSRVRSALAHEVPTYDIPELSALPDLPDETIATVLKDVIPNNFVGNKAAWDDLGEEALVRFSNNYARWAKGYIRTLGCAFPVEKEALKGKPLEWSVGASTPMGMFFNNVVTAAQLGQEVRTLPGMHFPYVSDVERYAEYVVERTRKYL